MRAQREPTRKSSTAQPFSFPACTNSSISQSNVYTSNQHGASTRHYSTVPEVPEPDLSSFSLGPARTEEGTIGRLNLGKLRSLEELWLPASHREQHASWLDGALLACRIDGFAFGGGTLRGEHDAGVGSEGELHTCRL